MGGGGANVVGGGSDSTNSGKKQPSVKFESLSIFLWKVSFTFWLKD